MHESIAIGSRTVAFSKKAPLQAILLAIQNQFEINYLVNYKKANAHEGNFRFFAVAAWRSNKHSIKFCNQFTLNHIVRFLGD